MKNNLFLKWLPRKFKQWIYIYLFVVYILFTIVEVSFIMHRGKEKRIEGYKAQQDVYACIANDYILNRQLKPEQLDSLNSLVSFFPDDLCLTVMDKEGNVLYDNFLKYKEKQINLKDKIEIKKAALKGVGWNIRKSALTQSEYMFYAVYKGKLIIRVAMPLTDKIRASFRPDWPSFSFILSLFVLVFVLQLGIIYFVARSITRLKEFVLSFGNDSVFPDILNLPRGELREIQTAIVDVFEQLEIKKKDALLEREKLLEHFHFSEEGISFFTPFHEVIYTNSHFIQYLNTLLNEPTIDVRKLFKSPVFGEISQFLEDPGARNVFTDKLHANGCHFFVRVIVFDDKSFEIIIRDVSEAEKAHIDRAEMANNIAHELRTPVTSVRGYLETLTERENMLPEKKKEYIDRAYNQIIRLSQIIEDVILLGKTNDAPHYFTTEWVNIYDMLKEMLEADTRKEIQRQNCKVNLYVTQNVVIQGNRTLLYSIFFNLYTNALKYAGENITITIHNYMEDDEFYYFSFSDDGKGIEEQYLDHIFERFYRITEGRTRDKGGSGLGLSIVKDAVNFHKGVILAKNRAKGGLEFLFTLRKK